MSTTTSAGNVKITYWGEKRREREDDAVESIEPDAKKTKSSHDHETQVMEPATRHDPDQPKKPRARLWHEPPMLNYSHYEAFLVLQKKIKEEGGPDLPLRSDWVDTEVELEINANYIDCVTWEDEKVWNAISDSDKAFYRGLFKELWIDLKEISNFRDDALDLRKKALGIQPSELSRADRFQDPIDDVMWPILLDIRKKKNLPFMRRTFHYFRS